MASRFKTSLADGAPKRLTNEWHPTKNGTLTPRTVGIGSAKKVWWLGKCGHEWETSPGNRYHQGRITACPFCSNQRVSPENNFAKLAPELAKQWNHEKNGDLKPDQFTYKSSVKVWWRCPRNSEHEWQASMNDRHKYGCPRCYSHISKPHLRIFTELLPIFPDLEIHHKIEGLEFDIFLHKHNLAIEYDGARWHKRRIKQDKQKTKEAESFGIKIFRIREKNLAQVSDNDLFINGTDVSKADLLALLDMINHTVSLDGKTEKLIEEYRSNNGFWNEKKYAELLTFYPGPLKGQSVKDTNPELIDQWDIELNHGLIPENFSAGSRQVVRWTCSKGHIWSTSIKRRAIGEGCPYCTGKRVAKENSLAVKSPRIADQWNYDRNGELTPDQVTYKSKKKVWWVCPKNPKHEWQAGVGDRHKYGCPFCSGRRVTPDRSLASMKPGLAKEWHPTKNGDLKPEVVSPQSSKSI